MDPLWLAASKLRRDRLDECIALCDELLLRNPGDQAAWFIKCKAVLKKNFIDDIELDEESMAEALLDDNAVASMPRPGTSLHTPKASSSSGGSFDPGIRPTTNAGRPVTGFLRPASSRPMSGSGDIREALQSRSRLGTASRPMTTFGREVRLGTASLAGATTGALVDVERLNVKKYAKRTGLAMAITDYLLHVEHNTRKALEICAEATQEHDFKDWWWKARLGKCYFKVCGYGNAASFVVLFVPNETTFMSTSFSHTPSPSPHTQLGMLRDAERQFRSSLQAQPVATTYLELVNVYLRLDVPNTALDLLKEAWCVALLVLFSVFLSFSHLISSHALFSLSLSSCIPTLHHTPPHAARGSPSSRVCCWPRLASTTSCTPPTRRWRSTGKYWELCALAAACATPLGPLLANPSIHLSFYPSILPSIHPSIFPI